jgi:hypothetical protein
MCGRLMCDVKISAKELMRSRSYDLDALCEQVSLMRTLINSAVVSTSTSVRFLRISLCRC